MLSFIPVKNARPLNMYIVNSCCKGESGGGFLGGGTALDSLRKTQLYSYDIVVKKH